MIAVNISTNMIRVHDLPVDEHDTIKSVLDAQHVNYSVGMVSIDGATLRPSEINKTFAEMGVTEKCFLSVIVKADNASEEAPVPTPKAKVVVAGSVVAIESAFTPEQLTMVKKFRPNALSLFETQEGHKVPTFTIGVSKMGDGSVNAVGASYGARASASGKAMIVMAIPEDVKDAKEWAADKIGVSILKIRQIEDAMPAVIEEIKGEQAQVSAAITMM